MKPVRSSRLHERHAGQVLLRSTARPGGSAGEWRRKSTAVASVVTYESTRGRRARLRYAGLVSARFSGGLIVAMLLATGCESSRGTELLSPAEPAVVTSATPTFSEHVAPIIHRQCTTCHRTGGAAPFVLDDYASVARRGRLVLEVIESGYMPPWKPVTGYGNLAGARELSSDERETIRRWVESGSQEGDPELYPQPPRFPDGWRLGQPDVVLELPEPLEVSAAGYDQWQCFVLASDFQEDRYVRSVEIRPSNPRVVHHVIAYVDWEREARAMGDAGVRGFEGMCVDHIAVDDMLGGWAPGLQPMMLPEGLGVRLPAGADVVLDSHFQPTGRVEFERTRIGLTFATGLPESELMLLWTGAKGMVIPPGIRDYTVSDRFTLPVDVEVIAVLPHAHYIARDVRAWAELPDGTVEPLIWIDDWDFNWQGQYSLAVPLRLPRGSVLHCEYVFDNSERTANPHTPPRRVIGGSRSIDEMASFYVQVVLRSESDLTTLREAQNDHADAVVARTAHVETWSTWVVQNHDVDGELRCRDELGAAIVRDRVYLDWRFRDHPLVDYELLECRDTSTGGLRGVAALRQGGWDPSIASINEWLVPRDDREAEAALLSHAVQYARQHERRYLIMWLPTTSPVFYRLQTDHGLFGRATPYQEIFISYASGIDRGWLYNNWYQTMGDIDFF